MEGTRIARLETLLKAYEAASLDLPAINTVFDFGTIVRVALRWAHEDNELVPRECPHCGGANCPEAHA